MFEKLQMIPCEVGGPRGSLSGTVRLFGMAVLVLLLIMPTRATAQALLHKLDFPPGNDYMLIALEASAVSRETKGRWFPEVIIKRAERDIVWKMESAVIKDGEIQVVIYFQTRDGRSYVGCRFSYGGFDPKEEKKLDLVLERENDHLVINLPAKNNGIRRLIFAPGTGIEDFKQRFSVNHAMPLFKWENQKIYSW
jgi:hypothetical protein